MKMTGSLGKLEMKKRVGGVCKWAQRMDIEICKELPRVWPRNL